MALSRAFSPDAFPRPKLNYRGLLVDSSNISSAMNVLSYLSKSPTPTAPPTAPSPQCDQGPDGHRVVIVVTFPLCCILCLVSLGAISAPIAPADSSNISRDGSAPPASNLRCEKKTRSSLSLRHHVLPSFFVEERKKSKASAPESRFQLSNVAAATTLDQERAARVCV